MAEAKAGYGARNGRAENPEDPGRFVEVEAPSPANGEALEAAVAAAVAPAASDRERPLMHTEVIARAGQCAAIFVKALDAQIDDLEAKLAAVRALRRQTIAAFSPVPADESAIRRMLRGAEENR